MTFCLVMLLSSLCININSSEQSSSVFQDWEKADKFFGDLKKAGYSSSHDRTVPRLLNQKKSNEIHIVFSDELPTQILVGTTTFLTNITAMLYMSADEYKAKKQKFINILLEKNYELVPLASQDSKEDVYCVILQGECSVIKPANSQE